MLPRHDARSATMGRACSSTWLLSGGEAAPAHAAVQQGLHGQGVLVGGKGDRRGDDGKEAGREGKERSIRER